MAFSKVFLIHNAVKKGYLGKEVTRFFRSYSALKESAIHAKVNLADQIILNHLFNQEEIRQLYEVKAQPRLDWD